MSTKIAKIIRSQKNPRTLPLRHHSCVYTIHLMVRAKPYPIQRFVDTAPDGILAIGKTTDLAQRIRRTRSSIIDPKRTGEGALLHYIYDICTRLQKVCRYKKNHMERSALGKLKTQHSNLVRKEIRAIDSLISQYGEPPHSNSRIPGGCKI